MINSSSSNIELTVIVSMYNEEAIIENTVQRLLEALEEFPENWELLLINDGSTDNTLDIVSELAQNDERIRVLSYKKNKGRGYALRTGFAQCRGKYVITTESDLNYGKDIITLVYRELQDSEVDIVIVSPYTKGGRLKNVPFRRALLSRLGNRILKMTISANISTLTGMTRGYRGEVIRRLPLEEDGKEIHLEIVSKACMLGYQFSEIPATLEWKPPQKGPSQRRSKFKAAKLIRTHLLFGFHESPILLFGSLGSAACLIGFILGLYLCYVYFIKGEVIGGRVALILTTIFLILGGFSTFLFCFLSYQIKDLKKEVFKLRHKLP